MADYVPTQDDGARTAASPALRARSDLRTLFGMLHGSVQPVATFDLEVRLGSDADLQALDAAIVSVTGEIASPRSDRTGPEGVAQRMALLVSAVQSHFGHPIYDFARIEPLGVTAHHWACRVHLSYHNGAAMRQAVVWAIRTLNELIGHEPTAPRTELLRQNFALLGAELRKRAPESLNTLNIVLSAWQLGIPVTPVVGNVIRCGHGYRSRLLDSTFTDRTPVIGTSMARNKAASAVVLRQGGLPAPQHVVASSIDTARHAAQRLGYPLVVKPIDQDGGRGVYAGLRDEAAMIHAATQALQHSSRILVERHFPGHDFRLTVVDGEVVKVEQRVAAGVDGDGTSTVAELVAATQASPRFQRFLHNYGRIPVALDEEAEGLLTEQNLSAASVVEAGRRVTLRRKSNISAGGEQIAVPISAVHPDNLALAVRAAALLRLDLAGVDLLIADIAASWLQIGALICEVNAQPQIGVRTTPAIYSELLQRLLLDRGRIPVHLIVVAQHNTLSLQALAARAAQLGCNAIASEAGAWIDGTQVVANPLGALGNFRMLLADPRVEGALGVMTPEQIVSMGLPCAYLDSIVNLAGDAIAEVETALTPHTSALLQQSGHA